MTMHHVVEFSRPDNGADMTISLQISGNRLIGLLNTIDGLMFETGRYRLSGDDIIGKHRGDCDLRDLTESIRDEISAQRNNTTADNIRASMASIRKVA